MTKERRTTRNRIFIPLIMALLWLPLLYGLGLNVGRVQVVFQVWCVDDSGGAVDTGICANAGGTAFTTIGGGVSAASPGDEIRIAAGIYNSPTTFDKSLTISGGYAGGPSGWTTPISTNVVTLAGALTTNSGVTVTADDFFTFNADHIGLNGPGTFEVTGTFNWVTRSYRTTLPYVNGARSFRLQAYPGLSHYTAAT